MRQKFNKFEHCLTHTNFSIQQHKNPIINILLMIKSTKVQEKLLVSPSKPPIYPLKPQFIVFQPFSDFFRIIIISKELCFHLLLFKKPPDFFHFSYKIH